MSVLAALPLTTTRIGSGRPLVLFHGGVGSRNHWRANLERLSAHFELILPDLPGYGASPDFPGEIGPEGYIPLVTDWLEGELRGGRCGLVGFSFGAVVAAGLAARAPGLIDRLTLLGPGGFGKPSGREIATRRVPPGLPTDPDRRDAVAFNLGQWMLSRVPDRNDPVVDVQLANIAGARFDSRRISLQDRLLDDLRVIEAPIQILWGADDRLAHPSVEHRAALCRSARPDLEIHLLPDAGHWVQREAAERVDSLITRFHSGRS
jgi:2-hydroxy-6-oxonona-2,4-dienedioate hydrolase